LRQYELETGVKTWIEITDSNLSNHYESQQLQSHILEQVQLMSYENAAINVSKGMGNSSLSDMRLHGIVQEFSEQIKQEQAQQIS